MSLNTRISDLITVMGTDYKLFRTWITGSTTGDLTGLTTTAKSSLIAAINEVNAQGGGVTNLSPTLSATQVVVNSDTGTDATIPAADTVNAGVMTKAMFDKLTAIAAGADVTTAASMASATHAATSKATVAGLDEMAIADSEAAFAGKRVTVDVLKTYIQAALVDSAPATLDTLNELAAALGDDPNFATTISTSLSGKQPLDADLTAIAALVSAADKLPYATGAGTWSLANFTAAGRSLVGAADAAAQRTALDVYATSAFGNPDTDLVALYTTAKA